MAKCDNCEREIKIKECRIRDNMGTRYRNFCDDCIFILSKNAQVDVLNIPETEKKTAERIAETEKKTDERIAETVRKTAERIAKMEEIIMTTTHSFDGYRIKDYRGIIFDETITGIGLKTAFKSIGDMFASLSGEQMYAMTNRINELKIELINRLKAKAVSQGANAIIGIDFESTMPGAGAIMVSANGTAVIIEKVDQ